MFLLHAEIKSKLSQRAHLHIRLLKKISHFIILKLLYQSYHSILQYNTDSFNQTTGFRYNPSSNRMSHHSDDESDFSGILDIMFIMLETFTTYVSMITKMSMQNFLLLITQMRLSQLESVKAVVKIQISMRT